MKRPRINHNLVDLCTTGFWWCPRCQSITQREEDITTGMGRCLLCGYTGIKWKPPVLSDEIKATA